MLMSGQCACVSLNLGVPVLCKFCGTYSVIKSELCSELLLALTRCLQLLNLIMILIGDLDLNQDSVQMYKHIN